MRDDGQVPETTAAEAPLAGRRVGVTAARKVEEQRALLERRGAEVVWAPVLGPAPYEVDDEALRTRTEQVLAGPVDVVVGTTGIGMRTWLTRAEVWGLQEPLLAALRGAEVLARGPKTVGALRRFGVQEAFVAPREDVAGLRERLLATDLRGRRVVVQEHAVALDDLAAELRAAGARVELVTVYRIGTPERPGSVAALLHEVAARRLDAVTFTSALSVEAFFEAAAELGLLAEVEDALRGPVVALAVGHVTAAALEAQRVPGVAPERARLAAMVRRLEEELAGRSLA